MIRKVYFCFLKITREPHSCSYIMNFGLFCFSYTVRAWWVALSLFSCEVIKFFNSQMFSNYSRSVFARRGFDLLISIC